MSTTNSTMKTLENNSHFDIIDQEDDVVTLKFQESYLISEIDDEDEENEVGYFLPLLTDECDDIETCMKGYSDGKYRIWSYKWCSIQYDTEEKEILWDTHETGESFATDYNLVNGVLYKI